MKLFLFIALAFAFTKSLAEETPAAPAKKEPNLIQKDIEISKTIDNVASGLDKALTGKNPEPSENRTTVTIRNMLNWGEGGVYKYTPALDLALSLPNLEKQWAVKFQTYDEDQEDRGINRNRLKTEPLAQSYGAGVGFFQKLGEINTEFQPRIEYRNQLQLGYILKFTSAAKEKFLNVRPELQLFAKTDSGIGEFVGLDSDIHIYKTLIFTVVNEEQYLDRANVFSTNNGIVFSHAVNDRMSMTESLIFESSSRPTYHLDRYTTAIGFSHKLYPKVLHYTITPYLAFQRDLNFRGSPGLNVELDIIF